MHAQALQDRTDRTAGYNACTFGSRLEQNTSCTVYAYQFMRQSSIDQRYADQVILGGLNSLLDRVGHFFCLAGTKTDVAGLVADDHERRERQVLTALNDLGNTVDRDQLV